MTHHEIQAQARSQADAHAKRKNCQVEIKPLLGKPEDVERYNECFRKLLEEEQLPVNEFNLDNEFIFGKLPGVTVWSIGPPDILHDLPEGIDDRLLTQLVLKDAIDLPPNEIVQRIKSFKFYHGKFIISCKSGHFSITRSKAVQV